MCAAQQTLAQSPPRKPVPPGLVEALRFTIAQIHIEGNTLLSSEELQAAVKPFLGPGKRLGDLNAARSALIEAYRAKGYDLLSVDYDRRRSRGGTHYFVVREVRIGKVRVTRTKEIAEAEVRRQLPSLKEGETPRLKSLARELFLFNDNPGRKAALEYSAGGAGVTDVEVKVAEEPQSRVALTFNNTGTSQTGAARLGLLWNHSNFLGRSHQLVAGAVTSPTRPERVFQAGLGYTVPLPWLGDSLVFSASYSDVDAGRIADAFNISGKGTLWGARYQRNLKRDALSRHVLDFGYDERRFRDVIDFFGTNLGVSVTAKPLSAGYRYSALGAAGAISAGITLQQNLPGGARNDDATYAAARAGGRARWRSWQLDAAWQKELASGWLPAVRLAGQYTREPLIPSEQFGLGGLRAVRGFEEREGLGDRGWRANVELYGPRFGDNQRLLGFVDLGRSTRLNALPGEVAAEGLSSAGVGWRAQFDSKLQVSADVARVLNGSTRNPRGDWLLHVQAVWWF